MALIVKLVFEVLICFDFCVKLLILLSGNEVEIGVVWLHLIFVRKSKASGAVIVFLAVIICNQLQ